MPSISEKEFIRRGAYLLVEISFRKALVKTAADGVMPYAMAKAAGVTRRDTPLLDTEISRNSKILVAKIGFLPDDKDKKEVKADIYRDRTIKWRTPQGNEMAERLRPKSFATYGALDKYYEQFLLTTNITEADYWPLVEYCATFDMPKPKEMRAHAEEILKRLYWADAAPLVDQWILTQPSPPST